MNYRVAWIIDVDADSPREAAEKAREIQLRPDSIATVFEVLATHLANGGPYMFQDFAETIDIAELEPVEQADVTAGGGS